MSSRDLGHIAWCLAITMICLWDNMALCDLRVPHLRLIPKVGSSPFALGIDTIRTFGDPARPPFQRLAITWRILEDAWILLWKACTGRLDTLGSKCALYIAKELEAALVVATKNTSTTRAVTPRVHCAQADAFECPDRQYCTVSEPMVS
jgi:hypothetical protein